MLERFIAGVVDGDFTAQPKSIFTVTSAAEESGGGSTRLSLPTNIPATTNRIMGDYFRLARTPGELRENSISCPVSDMSFDMHVRRIERFVTLFNVESVFTLRRENEIDALARSRACYRLVITPPRAYLLANPFISSYRSCVVCRRK